MIPLRYSRILVTGGAGFIGSNLTRTLLENNCKTVVLDSLSYAGNLDNILELSASRDFSFIKGDINDSELTLHLLNEHNIDAVINLAAETHVDRSISGPQEFISTNILGTYRLLQSSLTYFNEKRKLDTNFPFLYVQVSTDEVFGSLGDVGLFTEKSPYHPRSPYSASKASADHLVDAWFHTFRIPTLVTHCSNNFGPRQYPEKLIPLVIERALAGCRLPVYGTGKNVRDWIHVDDHCRGIFLALQKGVHGEHYCFGGGNERTNLEVVHQICLSLEEICPIAKGQVPYSDLIEFVEDRAGHDWRYAIDNTKARNELEFRGSTLPFEDALRETVRWYWQRRKK